MQEKIMEMHPKLMKKALMESIHEQEALRAKYVVEKFRSEQTEHVPNIELPSNPTHKLTNFENTEHHRAGVAAVKVVGNNRLINQKLSKVTMLRIRCLKH